VKRLLSLCVIGVHLLAAGASLAARNDTALAQDLKQRRARLMEQLGPETILVLRSAPSRTYSFDTHYEYRQDSNLYYLTGIDQEGTTLVLMPGNRTQKEILFIADKDFRYEQRNGERLTAEQTKRVTGIDEVRSAAALDSFLASRLSGLPPPFNAPSRETAAEFQTFESAVKNGRARVAMLLVDMFAAADGSPSAERRFATSLRERFGPFTLMDATPLIWALRQVKTPYEQQVLRKSVEISSDAHRAGMRAARPGVYEYEVEAAIEQVYLARGGLGWGYPSIVASGPNATILHYTRSRRRLEPDDLLLVDAAGNYEYMTGDITRTYPVDGTFSERQKDLYGIVLAAQEAGMKAATIGATFEDISNAVAAVQKQGLLRLGLITDASGDQSRVWTVHGVTHFIGLDVHDVGDARAPLAPGMAFVIEPGIYVREGALEAAATTAEMRAFADKVRPAYEKYKHLGVRIEDSFLMTEKGLERLSDVPRTIEEIENFLKGRR